MDESLERFEELLEVLTRNRVSTYVYGPEGLQISFFDPVPVVEETTEPVGFTRQVDRIAAAEEREEEEGPVNPYAHKSLNLIRKFG